MLRISRVGRTYRPGVAKIHHSARHASARKGERLWPLEVDDAVELIFGFLFFDAAK